MIPPDRALVDWLPTQRWFGGKGRAITNVATLDQVELAEAVGQVVIRLVEVRYSKGDSQRYCLPLSAPDSTDLAHARLGSVRDGLADPAACAALLAAIRAGRRVRTAGGGQLVCQPGSNADPLAGPYDLRSIRPLGVEQSNSSVVFGEAVLLKVFRRLEDGPNPDLEVPRFLETRTGFRHLPRLVGTIEYDGAVSRHASLATLQELLVSEGDGWSLALAALIDGAAPVQAGTFSAELRALGQTTAELHLALASDPYEPAFAPEPITESDLANWRAAVRAMIDSACTRLNTTLSGLPMAQRLLAERVIAAQDRLSVKATGLDGLLLGPTAKIRHHGDYHLGQVLKRGAEWFVLDFEGEPLRPLVERRARHSALRDVAGMLRSFDYARRTALRRGAASEPALAVWYESARDEFLAAYFERADPTAPFLPLDRRAAEQVIEVFELEKAAYELLYELSNRPEWVEIPLGHLAGLASGLPL